MIIVVAKQTMITTILKLRDAMKASYALALDICFQGCVGEWKEVGTERGVGELR